MIPEFGDDRGFFAFLPGDVNVDGVVDGRDETRVKKIILGLADLLLQRPLAFAGADANAPAQSPSRST
jgi:hypothetical protein